MEVLVVDAANVVGSRPDGWWRDRAGAAARLREQLVAASLGEVWLVLEGAARGGAPEEEASVGTGGVRTVHAARDGDSTIVAEARRALEQGHQVRVVTADRELRRRVAALGAEVVGSSWLRERL